MTPEEQLDHILYGIFVVTKDKLTWEESEALAMVWINSIIPCTWKLSSYSKWGFIAVDQETTQEYWKAVKSILQDRKK